MYLINDVKFVTYARPRYSIIKYILLGFELFFLTVGYFVVYRDLKEMNTRQAKISVEVMKEVMNDKTLKTKGDKDRRLREKKQNNTKKFMDERKHAQVNLTLFAKENKYIVYIIYAIHHILHNSCCRLNKPKTRTSCR